MIFRHIFINLTYVCQLTRREWKGLTIMALCQVPQKRLQKSLGTVYIAVNDFALDFFHNDVGCCAFLNFLSLLASKHLDCNTLNLFAGIIVVWTPVILQLTMSPVLRIDKLYAPPGLNLIGYFRVCK